MKAANGMPGYPDNLKTKRQWAEIGYLPIDDALGEEFWTNRNCQHSCLYYKREDVKIATKEELNEYYKPIREARNKKRRERNARLRQERIEAEMREKEELERQLIYEKYKKIAKQSAIECNNPSEMIVYDVETTGLCPDEDEILQISIIDGDGNVLLNSYVQPHIQKSWEKAMRINGITPEMVQDAPCVEELIPVIQGIFQSANQQIAYNNDFDLAFLGKIGIEIDQSKQIDVMLEFAEVYGEWSEYYGGFKWQKLSTAAEYYGYEFSPHDSLEDVKATLYIYNKIHKR